MDLQDLRKFRETLEDLSCDADLTSGGEEDHDFGLSRMVEHVLSDDGEGGGEGVFEWFGDDALWN